MLHPMTIICVILTSQILFLDFFSSLTHKPSNSILKLSVKACPIDYKHDYFILKSLKLLKLIIIGPLFILNLDSLTCLHHPTYWSQIYVMRLIYLLPKKKKQKKRRRKRKYDKENKIGDVDSSFFFLCLFNAKTDRFYLTRRKDEFVVASQISLI